MRMRIRVRGEGEDEDEVEAKDELNEAEGAERTSASAERCNDGPCQGSIHRIVRYL
jgi:hypothetical protein